MMKRKGRLRRGCKSNKTEAQEENGISGDSRSNWIESMRDSIRIIGDIVSPANDEADWEVLRDEDPNSLKPH
jgi:hypothetical protein